MSKILEYKFERNLDFLLTNTDVRSLAVAVSGGVDSVALLMLLCKWAKVRQIKIIVMTVNHNLRAQSKLEVDYVVKLSQKLGLTCAVLNWFTKDNNMSNLQSRARDGRYKILTNICHKIDVTTILTAHHEDDHIENFLIRQDRKSGILGLTTNTLSFVDNIRIIRPLYGIYKSELTNYLTENNVIWFQDESNESIKYERNRFRYIINSEAGSFKENTETDLAECNKKAIYLRKDLLEAIAESVMIYHYGFARINLKRLSVFEYEIQLHLLNFVLAIVSGKSKTPRARSAIPNLDLFSNFTNESKTLHGCRLKILNCQLIVCRMFGRKPAENVSLQPNVIWDNRFTINGDISILPKEAYVSSLQKADYTYFKNGYNNLFLLLEQLCELDREHTKAILLTLPVIKIFEKVVAIPHISYYDKEFVSSKWTASFRPCFVSRFTHFC